ncbi:hypothetical protein Tco_1352602 [Tanacetum coccineum]
MRSVRMVFGGCGNPTSRPIITPGWKRFGYRKPRSFSTANNIPGDAENWIAYIEKISWFLGCADEFKARLASYKLEGDALNWWMAIKQAKGDGIVNTKFTDVAQVANAGRNIKILRERSSQNNKRNCDGDRIRLVQLRIAYQGLGRGYADCGLEASEVCQVGLGSNEWEAVGSHRLLVLVVVGIVVRIIVGKNQVGLDFIEKFSWYIELGFAGMEVEWKRWNLRMSACWD